MSDAVEKAKQYIDDKEKSHQLIRSRRAAVDKNN